ncbi:MAG: DUF86 domain-containing protein [Kangiellaceae bacterium]|nr:DUF86 domain-containing protein [Kangiellaceae bacterium]
MSHKDNSVYISHMQDCIARIDEYVESKRHFFESHLVQDAVVRNLQVMAESSQRLSSVIKEKHPDIPWKIFRVLEISLPMIIWVLIWI